MALEYFLKIDGVTGDATDKAHKGWFTVDGYDIGVTTPTSSATGTVAGQTQFSPLSVDLHSLTGVSALLKAELSNEHIKSVELVGVETTAKGTQQTVYDLKLSDALVGSFQNDPGPQGVETALTFQYDKVALTDGGGTTTDWNIVNLKSAAVTADSLSSAAASDSGTGAVAVPATSPVHYFLKIEGVTGDAIDKAHKGWFTVDGYDIGVTTPTSSATGTVAGQTQFSPLSVDLHSLTGVSALLKAELSNEHIKSVELVGVETTAKGTQQTVYDLKLSDALVGSFQNDPGPQGVETALTFQYDEVALTDGGGTTTDWNIVNLKSAAVTADSLSSAAASDSGTGAVAVPATSPVHYFLKIEGVTGDAIDKAHKGWFTVDGYDIGVTTPTSSATGTVAGQTQFSPLSVDLHSLTGVSALLKAELSNEHIKSVELVGVETTAKGTQQTVYDLKLSDALVGSFQNDPGPHGVETALTFQYDEVALTDGGGTTTDWNIANLKSAAVTADSLSSAAASDSGTGAVAVPANSPVHYFLKIDGVTGDATDKAHKGWLTVDGYDIGVKTPMSSSIGTVAGRTQFSPFSVDLHSLTGVSALLEDELSNKDIKSVELVGVETTAKGTQQTVYDLKLSNALVDSFQNDPGTQGVETALIFQYDNGALTDASGTTTKWSTAVKTDGAAVTADSQSTSTAPDSANAAVTVPANSPVHYFLKIDGVTGDATDKAHKGWFTVDGYDIGVKTPMSSSTGTVAGRTQFSPFSVDLHSLTGVSALLEDELSNKDIKSVELVGVETTAKGTQQTVYDLKLSNALVDSFQNDPGPQGVETALIFQYDNGALTDASGTTTKWSTAVKTDGAAVTADSQSTSTAPDSANAAVAVPANSPVHYFLKIDGVTGDATDKAHKGWFTVDGYDIGVTTPTSSTGPVVGRAQFSPLSVDLHSLTGVSALLEDELTNKDIKSVELVGVETTAKGTQQTVYDLKLTDALVGSFENDPGPKGAETALTFQFSKGTLTNYPLSQSGQLGPAETVAFDTTPVNAASILGGFMASSDLGSGPQASVFTPLTHQDNPWTP